MAYCTAGMWRWIFWQTGSSETLVHIQHRTKGRARQAAARGSNLSAAPVCHWNNPKCGAGKLRFPHSKEYLWTLSVMPIPMAARSTAWVCGRSLAGIVGSNPAGGMDVCLLWMLCVVRYRSLRRANHSSREVLPSVVCLSQCDREASIMRRPWLTSGCCAMEK
jgi:hypothetical protein